MQVTVFVILNAINKECREMQIPTIEHFPISQGTRRGCHGREGREWALSVLGPGHAPD